MKLGLKSSTESEVPLVALGKVTGAHGLRGSLRVYGFSDDAKNLLQSTHVFVSRHEAGREAKRYEVLDATVSRGREVRIRLEGVSDRNAAELLRGAFVFAERQALQKLGPGEYYWHELLGCRVEDEQGVEIGVVESLLETGAHDVLVVRASAKDAAGLSGDDRGGKRTLIPTVPEFLREVDVEKQRIVVHVIPGLLDAS